MAFTQEFNVGTWHYLSGIEQDCQFGSSVTIRGRTGFNIYPLCDDSQL